MYSKNLCMLFSNVLGRHYRGNILININSDVYIKKKKQKKKQLFDKL